jgi:hypothetical protein
LALPFDPAEPRQTGLDEILRRIREAIRRDRARLSIPAGYRLNRRQRRPSRYYSGEVLSDLD